VTPRFGTDGIRGVANTELTPELVLVLGRAAGTVLTRHADVEGRAEVLVGRDTRASSDLLSQALAAGLASVGVDVIDLGVIPTGGVAILCRELAAPAAAVVSASHNPAADNGVKFFGPGGQKLASGAEEEIERLLEAPHGSDTEAEMERPVGAAVGRVSYRPEFVERYLEALMRTVEHSLEGLHVVVDAANGAASVVGPEALRRAGATVDVRFAEPDGMNINDGCGATAPAALARAVAESGADCGVAFDGDADRLVAVDARGRVVDGDHILAVCALDRHERGVLQGDGVVATVMSNVGLEVLLREHGIGVRECAVGDRNVLLALEAHGLMLGGEQSGHIIFRDECPTGCGILTALQLLQVMARTSESLASLAGRMTTYPQISTALPLKDRRALDAADTFWQDVRTVEAELSGTGRVVVRPSGTEPVLRIMVQASTETDARSRVDRLVAAASAFTN